jgi:hypothetical protein
MKKLLMGLCVVGLSFGMLASCDKMSGDCSPCAPKSCAPKSCSHAPGEAMPEGHVCK